jgi:hypothetical protein
MGSGRRTLGTIIILHGMVLIFVVAAAVVSCHHGHDANHRGCLDGHACATACREGGCYPCGNGVSRFASDGRSGNDSRDDCSIV